MHIWLWLCILEEFCRIWIASSLLVSFMQCKLVYKSIICSIRFFDFNFQGAIGMAIPRFLFSFFASKSLSSFYLFCFFNFHRRRQHTATLKYQIFQAAGQNLVDWQS